MPQVKFKFPFGIKVKDKLTGYTGLIGGALIKSNGNIQYNLHPVLKKDAQLYPHADVMLDEDSLVPVGAKPKTAGPVVDFKLNLGDQVKNRIHGFKGIVVSQTVFTNLCLYYGVDAHELNKETGKPIHLFSPESEWEYVGPGLNASQPAPKEEYSKPASKRTGGPAGPGLRQ